MVRKVAIAFAIAATFALVVAARPAAAADPRCNGAQGVQVWQDSEKRGPSFLYCSSSGTGIADLSTVTIQLSWGANWNNRISSYEVFNTPSCRGFRFFERTDFRLNSTTPPGFYITTYGNGYIPYTGAYWRDWYPGGLNDAISSIKPVNKC